MNQFRCELTQVGHGARQDVLGQGHMRPK